MVLLNGRYAGRKAVVVRSYESGNAGRSCVYGVCGPLLWLLQLFLHRRMSGRQLYSTYPRVAVAFSITDRKFSHVLVAGIDRHPRKVTRKMSKEQVAKKSKIKPFVKYINVTHVMPTRLYKHEELISIAFSSMPCPYRLSYILSCRYTVDMDLKLVVDETSYNNNRVDVRKAVKKILEDRYRNQGESKSDKRAQGNKFLFTKLRF